MARPVHWSRCWCGVYYSAQVFLYGAELTHVYALKRRRVASGSEHYSI